MVLTACQSDPIAPNIGAKLTQTDGSIANGEQDLASSNLADRFGRGDNDVAQAVEEDRSCVRRGATGQLG